MHLRPRQARPRRRSRDRLPVAVGLAGGVLLDALVPDPRRGHPVALFGRAADALERRVWADDVVRGGGYWIACVAPPVALGVLGSHTGPRRRAVLVAAATWAVLGGRSLRHEAGTIEAQLAAGDLPAAREQLTHLVGRDPSLLDAAEIARAAVESVAENTCDAVVAPLFWGAVAGLPGLLGYRAANTLDAMVGHRSPRHERFGRAAARLDDVANLVPARLSALLVAVAAPLVGGSARAALRTAVRDARRHPSPNAGWSEAAFAGALGVHLGGRNDYGGRVEERPRLGDGRPAAVADLPRATRLCAAVTVLAGVAAAGVVVAGVVATGQRSSRSPSVSR